MASTADIKNGIVLNIDGQLWSVIEFQHVKPGKGGAFVRTKLKNVTTGKTVDRTYNAGAKIEITNVDRRDYQYLYQDGADFVFMDTSDYDQITIPGPVVGDAANFMLENQNVTVALHEGSWLYVREILDGVIEHQDEIDEQIETYAQGWTLARMPAVDRAILRIGVWEVLYNDEVPDGVAISEAVEAATVLSTDDSAGFVNGLLAKIAQTRSV